jgi:hypothetical protein
MSTDKRKAQFRAYYYRHQEDAKKQARELAAKKRAEQRATETPEQADQRRAEFNAYARAQYEKKKDDRRAKRNQHNAKTGAQKTPKRVAWRKAWKRKQYYTKPSYRIAQLLRDRLRHALRGVGVKKSQRTLVLLGCDLPMLLKHIEVQWSEGMSWSNFGNGHGRWNIDHIRPCASFRLDDEEQQRACFHFSNLRPAWWIENLRKNSFYNGQRWSQR